MCGICMLSSMRLGFSDRWSLSVWWLLVVCMVCRLLCVKYVIRILVILGLFLVMRRSVCVFWLVLGDEGNLGMVICLDLVGFY